MQSNTYPNAHPNAALQKCCQYLENAKTMLSMGLHLTPNPTMQTQTLHLANPRPGPWIIRKLLSQIHFCGIL